MPVSALIERRYRGDGVGLSDGGGKSHVRGVIGTALDEWESSLRSGDHARAGRVFVDILAAVERGTVPGFAESDADRFVEAAERFLGDPGIPFSKRLFLGLNKFKRSLVHVFQISGRRGTSHMKGMAKNWNRDFLNGEGALRIFSALSLNAMAEEHCEAFLRLNPRWSFPVLLGFLSEQLIYTAHGEEARSRILGAGALWEGVDPGFYALPGSGREFPLSLAAAYMGCSYAEAPHKHAIKQCMNKVVRRWLDKNGVPASGPVSGRSRRRRPHVVIFAELYGPCHAMHRCYGPAIESLKEDFETTLVAANVEPHPQLEKLAHRVEALPVREDDPLDLIARLRALQPDILYLPSVGMRFTGIAVSNARIAPVQIRSQGHPATTHSDAVDYAILDVEHAAENLASEKMVLTGGRMVFAPRPDARRVVPNLRRSPGVTRFAVPAWCRKVTPGFLEACRRIREVAKGKVEFCFFPNVSGVLFESARRIYSAAVPGAVVVPRKDYNAHIRDLNECDIFLSTFPFGATNGIIDAFLQGLPVVNLKGGEAHSRIDAAMAGMVGQPGWLTAHSVDGYVDAAVRLVDEPGLRVDIGRKILEGNPEAIFFDRPSRGGFAGAVRFIWDNHEAIQASPQRIWPCPAN